MDIFETKTNSQTTAGYLVDTIMLWVHDIFCRSSFEMKKTIRDEIKKHPKGYVSLDFVLAHPDIKSAFRIAKVEDPVIQKQILRGIVWEHPGLVRCNYNSIRSLH